MQLKPLTSTWQESLSHLVTDPKELFELLHLDPNLLPEAYEATKLFPLKVTHSFIHRMQKGTLDDPLLKQVLPLGIEKTHTDGFENDPLKESDANPTPGLLHKYESRVLVMLTSVCAIHCRYCFRRHFPYSDNIRGKENWEKIIDYIRQDENINEVILSSGDPLAVSDRLLQSFTDQLNTIPQVKTLRIHSRIPVVLPERITDSFITWAMALRFKVVLVIHANHPHEINEEVRVALRKLREANVTLFNQSVLLRGVNDDAGTLVALSEILFEAGVLPYYLHLPDKVQGTAHFDVALEKAKTLHQAISAKLPGYLVPKLVREEPGKPSKTIL